MNKLIAIFGPTAVGKTELAVKLCQKFNGEIVSVDSRQAYREMEVGTGKVTTDNSQLTAPGGGQAIDRRKIPIHLYNLAEPGEQINAYDYSLKAWEKIEEIWSRRKIPFLVGGTGFYLDVILGRRKLAGVSVERQLRLELEKMSLEKLRERLQRLDPQKLQKIDVDNKYRLIRAVEIAAASGEIFQGHPLNLSRGDLMEKLIIGLTAENSYLYRKADERVELMVKAGLLEEVQRLAKKYGWESPGLKTLGYKEFEPYFRGSLQLNEAVQKIKFNTHAFIRRQKTYFRKYFADGLWFDIQEGGFERRVADKVESFL